ncbi:MAG TPA: hypothetical protein VMW27_29105 [Thermoanaerobaculia bacterium]|nr:hypothetical protein [Thermoanaerobaculia bacterium]
MKTTRTMLPLLALGLAFAAATPAKADGPFQFHSLTPCRIVDTRNAAGPTGGPALNHGQVRSFPIQGNCGVPSGAKAVALNVTVVSPAGGGHLTIFPSGTSVPLVSTLNFNAGEPALANGAIVPLSANANDLSTQPAVIGGNGTVHLILDVTGYFQ